jgi:DNA-binding Lrp family transcriptional regulator
MSSQAKLTEKDREEIRDLYKNARLSSRRIARRYGISHSSVLNLLSGKTYEHIITVRSAPVKEVQFKVVKGITVSFK